MRAVAAAVLGLLLTSGLFAQTTGQGGAGALTCDPGALRAESYRLTTEAQALNVTKPRSRWWDNYDIGREPKNPQDAAIAIAERARELDDRNLLAHAQLARYYVQAGVDADKARDAWRRTLDAGGAIVWTATLFDVDDRSFFVVAFDRQGIRLYRFGQLAGALRTTFGVPEFPGPDREDLWRALGGCFPPGVTPEATIAWDDVRELESGEYVLAFELARRVDIASDRRKRRSRDTVVINLHPVMGEFDYRYMRYRPLVLARNSTVGPAAFQERIRGMLIEFFDPDGSIRVPKQRRWSSR
jgi:hypothetical protein